MSALKEFVVKITITKGIFKDWKGFAKGGLTTKDDLGNDLSEPKMSLMSVRSLDDAGKFSYPEAMELGFAFFNEGIYLVEIMRFEEAEMIML